MTSLLGKATWSRMRGVITQARLFYCVPSLLGVMFGGRDDDGVGVVQDTGRP